MSHQMLHHWDAIENVVNEMAVRQKELLLQRGRQMIPTLTPEDILQPNDYPELEYHPGFRYEEGMLAGIRSVQMALLALKRDQLNAKYTEEDSSM